VRASAAFLLLLAGISASGAVSASKAESTAGPVATARPTVVGTAAVGRRITGLTGTWAGSGSIAYAFQWYRCDGNGARCLSIHGATLPTYRLVGKDAAKTIGLTVTATDRAGSASAYASLLGPIAPSPPLLVVTAQPVLTGVPVQGKALQVTTGAWSPTPEKLTYAWLRCNPNGRVCGHIAGASGSSYTVGALDVAHALVALVQGTFGTTSQSALSTATPAAVAADVVGPTRIAGPSVSGAAVRGGRLTASAGTWSSVGPISYAYKWYRCDTAGSACNTVSGATAATYRLTARDVGRTVALRIEATDPTGVATAFAGPFGPIAEASAPLVSTIQPALSGDPRVGRALTVSPGGWTPAPASYAYAWQRCTRSGRDCVPIGGASGSSYVLQPADAGHVVAAVVTATVSGASQSAFSTTVAVASG
jgi:hypothetical protein